jgi:protein-L-isoaspartate(D-aspartate) O-methyltransferase
MISPLDETQSTFSDLIKHLAEGTGVLKNHLVRKAFVDVDRAHFVDPDYLSEAYEDYPLPIGHGQTISQPTTVAFMLELLDARKGEKILDIGSGSGWTTALLAHIVGQDGRVFGVELIPDLVEFGKKNLARYNFKHASIEQAGENLGLPREAPFDRILVSAAADNFPQELLAQLKTGGVLVVPIQNSIYKIEKISEQEVRKKEYPGFVFVPLIKKQN